MPKGQQKPDNRGPQGIASIIAKTALNEGIVAAIKEIAPRMAQNLSQSVTTPKATEQVTNSKVVIATFGKDATEFNGNPATTSVDVGKPSPNMNNALIAVDGKASKVVDAMKQDANTDKPQPAPELANVLLDNGTAEKPVLEGQGVTMTPQSG